MLTDEMNAERVRVTQQLLDCAEAEAVWHRLVSDVETWVHHCDPENRTQSMEYWNKDSPPDFFQ